jgi:hypothetical protein
LSPLIAVVAAVASALMLGISSVAGLAEAEQRRVDAVAEDVQPAIL